MTENNNQLNIESSLTLAKEAVKILLEKKGIDVRLFDVRESSAITDFYVNVTGRSHTQVSSLARDLTDRLSLLGRNELRVEGRQENSWLLVDYGDVIVNVFDKQTRDFYNLDRHLPSDSQMDISDLIAEVDSKFSV